MWWGKLLGSAAGFYPGGPIGMAVGFMLGHLFDRWFRKFRRRWTGGSRHPDRRAYNTFFRTTFLCLGYLAKAKGRVAESDIEYARAVMDRLALDADQRQQAMACFGQGKSPEFDLGYALSTFRQAVRSHPQLIHLFMETQIAAAYADGQLGSTDQAVLKAFSRGLHVNAVKFQWLHARVVAQQRAQQQVSANQGQTLSLASSYRVLGVGAKDSNQAVKQAYRRAMSQNHPDKLMSRGLSEAEQRAATERVHEIQRAYETITTHRQKQR